MAMMGAINPVLMAGLDGDNSWRLKDYVARGRHFAELAGFDPEGISGIAGMGIA